MLNVVRFVCVVAVVALIQQGRAKAIDNSILSQDDCIRGCAFEEAYCKLVVKQHIDQKRNDRLASCELHHGASSMAGCESIHGSHASTQKALCKQCVTIAIDNTNSENSSLRNACNAKSRNCQKECFDESCNVSEVEAAESTLWWIFN